MAPLSSIFLATFALVGVSMAQEDPVPTPNIGPWSYAGCVDETEGRSLGGPSIANNMTAEICLTYCTNQDYPLAGLEFGNECFCGTSLLNGATYGQSGCNMGCTGNPSQVCGGVLRITVYESSDYVAPGIVPTVGTYTSLGCYTEATTERALKEFVYVDKDMTVDLCVSTCEAQGFVYAGVEYATECYCANTISPESVPAQDSDCSMKCPGNQKTFCGGPDRLVVYQN